MKMRDYMKKKKREGFKAGWSELGKAALTLVLLRKKEILCSLGAIVLVGAVSAALISKNVSESDIDAFAAVKLPETSIAAAAAQRSVIAIPKGIVKANPFVPYRDITETGIINDVPAYSLVEPPEVINENSDAARVMDTIVSGILFDRFSPSAIINIEGSDYLVKKGDVVNNYKVVAITQDSVTVQLGANAYTAGIGEILTEGTLNHNEVSNLNNKFGGEK